ncbi:ABC transporter substrate-binding protein [Lachnospiraceae bacterium C1.1]|nr:ABC transporter substrate-binding protein [Lachnospiraceae bacterium C1.1]
MFKKSAKIISCVLATAMLLSLTACGKSEAKISEISIACQNGLAYAPLKVMEANKLIEKYEPDVKVNWQTLNSGSAINEGLTAGAIQFGGMGLGPAITAITSGIPVKIASAMSSQPHKIMTNRADINSLTDIKAEDKIALVNIGSFQHILLAMAAEKNFGDAHALDNNIVAMSHPDGMAALESGSVDCQLTTSPYIYKEAENSNLHEVEGLSDVWPDGNSFIVFVGSESLKEKDPELYENVVKALQDAIDWINENPDEAAALLCNELDVDEATAKEYLTAEGAVYSSECKGVMQYADFMASNGFLENDGPESFSDLVFDNVKGD